MTAEASSGACLLFAAMETLTCYVTGGTGHVGANLVRELLAAGHEVQCLIRKDTRTLNGLGVSTVDGDLLSIADMRANMQGVDAVFHGAAVVGVERDEVPLMERINVGGTNAMVTAALEAGVSKFVHISSVHAFAQRPTSEALTESRPLVDSNRAAPYDRTKADAQRKVLAAVEQGLDASMLHPTGVLGPYDWKPSRMGQVLRDMATGAMPATLNTGFNWVDARDVAKTALAAANHGKAGQHYLVAGEWGSMPRLAAAVKACCPSASTPRLTLPFWTAYTALPFAWLKAKLTGGRPSVSRGSLHALAVQCRDIPASLARTELGHDPRPLEETVRDALKWQYDEGLLDREVF